MVGKNIRALRKGKKMSINKLSNVSGVSLGFISDIENSKTNPSIPTLIKIAKALNIKMELFFKKDLIITLNQSITKENLKKYTDNQTNQLKEESELYTTGKFKTAKAAMQFILKQPSLMAYGGYDVQNMSDEDIIEFANDLLGVVKALSSKYSR